jgi:ATP-binding cassette subfamily F protein 3
LFEFTPEGIREHLDGIDEFLEKKNIENMRAFEKVEKPVAQKQEAKVEDSSADKDKEAQRVKKQIGQLEQKIEKLEKSIAEYDEQLQNPQQYAILTADTQFFTKYENLKKELETTMAEWERLADLL